MLNVFLLTVVISAMITVALSSLAVYLFAEAKWREHPLAHDSAERMGPSQSAPFRRCSHCAPPPHHSPAPSLNCSHSPVTADDQLRVERPK